MSKNRYYILILCETFILNLCPDNSGKSVLQSCIRLYCINKIRPNTAASFGVHYILYLAFNDACQSMYAVAHPTEFSDQLLTLPLVSSLELQLIFWYSSLSQFLITIMKMTLLAVLFKKKLLKQTIGFRFQLLPSPHFFLFYLLIFPSIEFTSLLLLLPPPSDFS